ncbi:MAG TPA: hypothetical protein VIT42_20190 [Microlunatus sp.]
MTRTGRAALLVAILISAYSLAEAVATGLTGHPMLDPDAGPAVARGVVGLLLTATFTLSVAVLHEQSTRIDADSRPRRWLRRLLQTDLGVCAAVGAISLALIPTPGNASIDAILGAVGGVAFLLAFVLGAAFGLTTLVRRPELRAGAICLAAIAVLVPVTIVMGVLHSPWTHIAYAETALYIGIALLARIPHSLGKTGPAHARPRAHLAHPQIPSA